MAREAEEAAVTGDCKPSTSHPMNSLPSTIETNTLHIQYVCYFHDMNLINLGNICYVTGNSEK